MVSNDSGPRESFIKYIEYIMISVLYINLLFLIPKHTMWLDELDWGIGIIIDNNSLKDVFLAVLKTGENLPLFYIPLYFSKCFFGYEESAFILISIIVSFIGMLGIIKISRTFFDAKVEFFSVFWVCTSYLFAGHSLQVRPYSYLFTFSVWTLYFYLKRLKEESYSNIIKYGISMIFLMYTHWFGILISLVYAFVDLVLFIKKKIKLKCIVSYLIGGLAFLPSFIMLLIYHNGDVKEFGVEPLTFLTAENVFFRIVNLSVINFVFLIIAYIIIVRDFRKKNKDNFYINIIAFVAMILISGVFVYSKLYPKGNLVRPRYFITIIPHIALVMGWLGALAIAKLKENKIFNSKVLSVYLCIYLVFMFGFNFLYLNYMPNAEGVSIYQRSSDYLSKQEDIYDENTLVIHVYGKTWIDYYFVLKDKKLPSNIISVDPLDYPNTLDKSEESLDYFKYFVRDGKKLKSPEKIDSILDYDTIYCIVEYRNLSKDFIEELDENYDSEKIDGLNIIKYTKTYIN